MPPGEPFRPNHSHQLLPSQLRPAQRQWRLVQPSSPTLRPRNAHVPQACPIPCWNHPRLLPPVSLGNLLEYYNLISCLLTFISLLFTLSLYSYQIISVTLRLHLYFHRSDIMVKYVVLIIHLLNINSKLTLTSMGFLVQFNNL